MCEWHGGHGDGDAPGSRDDERALSDPRGQEAEHQPLHERAGEAEHDKEEAQLSFVPAERRAGVER